MANVQMSDAGDYTVVVSNTYGSVTSSVARAHRPVAARDPDGRDRVAACFRVVATNTVPGTTYQWYFNGSALSGASLCLTDVQPAQGGAYTVAITTANGAVTSAPGSSVRIDCLNAIGPTDAWVTLATVTLTNSSQSYFDLTAFRQAPRLYRLVPLP
jgi:hypothetical protein